MNDSYKWPLIAVVIIVTAIAAYIYAALPERRMVAEKPADTTHNSASLPETPQPVVRPPVVTP